MGAKLKKTWIYLLIALLCAVIFTGVYLQLRGSDYHYNYDVAAYEMERIENPNEYFAQNPNTTKPTLLSGDTDYEGLLLISNPFILNETEYSVGVNYTYTGNSGAFMTVADKYTLDESGTAGKELARVELSPDNTTTTFVFENTGYNINIVTQVYVPTGAELTIESIHFQSTDIFYNDALFKTLLFAAVIFAVMYLILNVKADGFTKKRIVNFCVCLLIGVSVSVPFLNYELMHSHDILFHLGRIDAAYLAIIGGELPMRINSFVHTEFGYLDPIYYPNLFIYFAGALRALGVSLINSYKGIYIMLNIATAAIAFYSANKLSNSRKIAMVFSVFYTFSIYRLVNIHTRGALGESLAMTFIPLAFYALHCIIFRDKKPWIAFAAAMTCIIGSHVLSVILICVFLLAYCVYNYKHILNKLTILTIAKSAALTTALSAWWVIPFISYASYPTNSYNQSGDLSILGAQFSQLFSIFSLDVVSFATNYSTGITHEMPHTIGILAAIGTAFYIYRRFYVKCEKLCTDKHMLIIGNFCLIFFALSIFASTTSAPYTLLSKIELFSFISVLQFPFRILAYSSFFACVLTALAVSPLLKMKKNSNLLFFVLLIIPIVFSMPYTDALATSVATKDIGSSNVTVGMGDLLYFPREKTIINIDSPENSALYCEDESVVFTNAQRGEHNATDIQFTFENPSAEAQSIRLPLLAYPDTTAYIDGSQLTVRSGEYAEVMVDIPQGVTSGTVYVEFASPWYFRVGEVISLLSFVALMAYFIYIKILPKISSARKSTS